MGKIHSKNPKIPLQKQKNPLLKNRKPLNKKPNENPVKKVLNLFYFY